MPLDFPSSPTSNQEYSFAGKTWYWDGVSWVLKATSNSVTSVYFQASAPTGFLTSPFWINSDTGRQYIYVNDGSSSQWIELGVASSSVTGTGGGETFSPFLLAGM